ncbi:DUF7144 family membrane protein [Yinghuangia seranimata]|uniref:DUF7144 family membrane protein n=1 Tax=Yinghuangia seranimata TaxID=408067 RepID=UPI00248D2F82|nr:hypothetical protein [Yinghuangia seranimata]MDI2129199.1 hypothetical protein [Yinghuangia seranimata]
MARKSSGFNAWSGWVAFAAFALLTLGVLNLMQGLTSLFRDGYFVTASGDDLLLRSYTTWGVILLCFAAVQLAAGMGLLTGQTWARFVAIGLAVLNIIGQIAFLAAVPLWSTIVIALDIVVLYALTARWSVSQGMEEPMGREEAAEWQSGATTGRHAAGSGPTTGGGREMPGQMP